MQFTLVTILSLVALALAAPARLDDITARDGSSSAIDAEAPAMSDASGNVVAFNAASVYQAATANGQ